MTKAIKLIMVCACVLLLPQCVWAQEEEPAAPPPVGTTIPITEPTEGGSTLTPDTRPLSGIEELEVESPGRSRSFVLPSLRLSTYGDTNRTILGGGGTGTELTGSVIGGLAVHQVTRRNDFSFDYQGGGMLYSRNSDLNTTIHQLGITETYQGRRWGITLGNRLSYLPESSFGFGGFGVSSGLGGGGGGGGMEGH